MFRPKLTAVTVTDDDALAWGWQVAEADLMDPEGAGQHAPMALGRSSQTASD